MYEKEVTIQTDVRVILHEPEKTKDYFIDGDWKETFFTFSDLDDLIDFLAHTTQRLKSDFVYIAEEKKGYRQIDIEGFPYFIRDDTQRDNYIAESCVDDDRETGKIEIIWDEEYYTF